MHVLRRDNRQQFNRGAIDKVTAGPSLRQFMKFLLLPLSFFASLSSLSHGAIVLGGNFSTGGTMKITEDLVFTITTSGIILHLGFDEWVTADATVNSAARNSSQTMAYSLVNLNGSEGPSGTVLVGNLLDNRVGSGAFTNNDGRLTLQGGIVVTVGQTLTLHADPEQTFTYASAPNFNQRLTPFSGNMFVTNNLNTELGTSIPEPAAALLGALGAIGLLRRRH